MSSAVISTSAAQGRFFIFDIESPPEAFLPLVVTRESLLKRNQLRLSELLNLQSAIKNQQFSPTWLPPRAYLSALCRR